MKSFLAPLALFVAAATAQSTVCAAENIVQSCMETQNNYLATCNANDWNCKCQAYQNMVTCYANCPGDSREEQAKGQQSIFCSYASQYPSGTVKPISHDPTPTATNTGAGASPTGTGTGTTTGAGAANTNSAAALAAGAGGLLAAVAGVVAAVL